MNAPTLRPDGSCPACIGGWQCAFHQAEGVRRDREKYARLRDVCRIAAGRDIARVCLRYELESDEFSTREQKALAIMARGAA